jgi:hypothetical protein
VGAAVVKEMRTARSVLGALRQTVLVLELRANQEERPTVAPDPRGRAKSEPGVSVSLLIRQESNPDIHLVRWVAKPV